MALAGGREVLVSRGQLVEIGGSFRLPWWGCYTLDGRDLETMGGIAPDIKVVNDLSHSFGGQDPQLDRAVAEALKLIKK